MILRTCRSTFILPASCSARSKPAACMIKLRPGVPDWQKKMSLQQWRTKSEIEPEVVEHLVAVTYRFTGEQLWVARVYSSVFWLLGGVFLFLLVRDLDLDRWGSHRHRLLSLFPICGNCQSFVPTRPFDGDVDHHILVDGNSLGEDSILELGYPRRAFWRIRHLHQICCGFLCDRRGPRCCPRAFRATRPYPQKTGLGNGCFGRPARCRLSFLWNCTEWFSGPAVQREVYPRAFAQSAELPPMGCHGEHGRRRASHYAWPVGPFDRPKRNVRIFLSGLWIAYFLFSFFFDYHVATHDYYHLPLLPLVAVSLAPLADFIFAQLAALTSPRWLRLAALGVLAYGLLAGVWDVRNQLKSVDYRPQAAMWAEIGDKLGHGPNVVALTQDYGTRLAYWGWQDALIWPNSGDIDYHEARGATFDSAKRFTKLTAGKAFFLVTDFDELNRQPELKKQLDGFAIYTQGNGYIIYDLQKPGIP